MRSRLAGFLALFLLWGCAAGSTSFYSGPVPKDGEPAGYVIASVSRSKELPTFTFYSLDFRSVATGDEGSLKTSTPELVQAKFEVIKGVYEGFVSVLKLPPGKYELYNFSVFGGAGFGSVTWSSKQDFSVPFEVQAGKATYIGAYDCTPIFGEGIFGLRALAGMYWILSDQHDRDVPIARGREPGLTQTPVDIAVPDPQRLNIPLITGVPPR